MEVLAGQAGKPGNDDGLGANARFSTPAGLALRGTKLVVADMLNNAVREIDLAAPGFPVRTVAKAPELSYPSAVAFGPDGTLYAVETGRFRIVSISSTGVVQAIAGGNGAGYRDGDALKAQLLPQYGLAALPGGELVFSDPGNYRVRLIAGGNVRTLAGTGRFGSAEGGGFASDIVLPAGLAVGMDGIIYVAEPGNGVVRGIRR